MKDETWLAALREDFVKGALHRADLLTDPIDQFTRWFDEAGELGVRVPNIMYLATLSKYGGPTQRTMLLKNWSQDGFVFFTNYCSRKGMEIDLHPKASLLFFWEAAERQIRIEGVLEKVPASVSDAYFATRPRESQLGAWASQQSTPVADRATLESTYEKIAQNYHNQPVPRPSHWGGYCLRPDLIEFWQGRGGRLHDRFEYTRNGDTWNVERLSP